MFLVLLYQIFLNPAKFERKSTEVALATEISMVRIDGDPSDHIAGEIRGVAARQTEAVRKVLTSAFGVSLGLTLVGWLTGLGFRMLFGNLSHLTTALLQTLSGECFCRIAFVKSPQKLRR